MIRTANAMRDVISKLYKIGGNEFTWPNQTARNIAVLLNARYPSLVKSSDDLESVLPSGKRLIVDFAESDVLVRLPPVTKGSVSVPVLSLKCDLSRSFPTARYRILLYLLEGAPVVDNLRSIGFRFETPEGPGTHDYCHVQLITAFEKNVWSDTLNACPPWLPTRQPAFPLDAYDPVGLLLCLLESLYGGDILENDMLSATAHAIVPFVQDRAKSRNTKRRYFALGSGRAVEHVETALSAVDLKKKLELGKKQSITPCAHGDFVASSKQRVV